MKIKNHCKVDIKGVKMEKALLEEHVRYGEARFRDKELVRPFVNRIYQDLAELEEAQLTRREWYQKGYNEAMKHKTCDGCKFRNTVKFVQVESETLECCSVCVRNCYDYYEPKDNA